VGVAREYQEEAAVVCIHGGATSLSSLSVIKHFSREILAVEPGRDQSEPLWWSHVPITFDAVDHPDRARVWARPLVVSLVIRNMRVTKMLVDGGACLNLISIKLMEVLQISKRELAPTGAFRGAIPGATQPLGKVVLQVTFEKRDNFRMEIVTFDVTDISLPYNGLLGRPALAQFMEAAHYASNMIKVPATWGVLTIRADIRDAVFCVAEMDKAATAGGPGNLGEAMPEDAGLGPSSPEPNAMVCEVVGPAPRKGKLMGEVGLTKKVPLGDGTSRTFTVGAALTPKQESALIAFLLEKSDVFAWEPSDHSGVPREVIEHHLAV
jgi:hypothetical protein